MLFCAILIITEGSGTYMFVDPGKIRWILPSIFRAFYLVELVCVCFSILDLLRNNIFNTLRRLKFFAKGCSKVDK